MADNNTTKERLKEITDSIESGIKELFESDKYIQYLRTMSHFHSYSLNNTLLISMQKCDAILVAGFNKMERSVLPLCKKGCAWHRNHCSHIIQNEKGAGEIRLSQSAYA